MNIQQVPSSKLTWNPKMEVSKMIFLFKQVIFRVHVNFRGSKPLLGDVVQTQGGHLLQNIQTSLSRGNST